MSLRPFLGVCFLIVAMAWPVAWAAEPAPAIESLQTLRIDGDLTVDGTGAPTDYRALTPLSDAQQEVLGRLVRSWRFFPEAADGTAAPATARIRITLAARSNGQGYDVVVDDVRILRTAAGAPRQSSSAAGSVAIHGRLSPPAYPTLYAANGVSATVHLLLRIGSDGRVADVAADSVALLNVYGSETKLRRALDRFRDEATAQARHWRFDVQLRPGQSPDAYFVVGVPVAFLRNQAAGDDAAGQWRSEIRIRSDAPAWAQSEGGPANPAAGDAFGLSDEDVDRFRLRTSVVGTKVM